MDNKYLLVKNIKTLDKLDKFETHNFLIITIRFFLVPLINNIPSSLIKKILRKTTRDSHPALEKGGSAHALEPLYTIHERKQEIFKEGILHGILTLFWHNILSQPKAIRNRLKIVKIILREAIKEKINFKKELKILSIGGGSCLAIMQAFNDLILKENFNYENNIIQLYNLDKHCDVVKLTRKNADKYNLNFIKVIGIEQSARNIYSLNLSEKFDIIEIVGLLDYFNQDETVNLLNYAFNNMLDEKGVLIWGNIRPHNEMKFLKSIGWPNMFYRDLPQIINILKKAALFQNNSEILIYEEPLKIHYIIECRKHAIT